MEILESFNNKLENLTEEEKKERLIYLKGLAEGTYQGPETGYLHIDKPWLKNYSEKFLNKDLPKKSIYEYLYEKSKGYFNLPALSYYGKKVLYKELHQNIYETARMLDYIGVGEDSTVLYLLPNIPETTYFFYSSAMVGAISDYIDPRPDSLDLLVSARKLLDSIKEEKVSHIVCLDSIYLAMIKPIEKELKQLGINDIITIRPDQSLDQAAKLRYLKQSLTFDGLKKTKEKLSQTNYIDKAFIEAKKNSILNVYTYDEIKALSRWNDFKIAPYIEDKICTIVHTSGTSGRPKPFALTHDNINSYVHQAEDMNMNFGAGDTALHILPFFAAYGIQNLLHPGLCNGVCMLEIPEFNPKDFVDLIMLYEPNVIVGVPTWYNAMKKRGCGSLWFVKWISFGGMPMTEKDEDEFNEFLEDHDCKVKVSKGFGLTETGGNVSLETGENNKIGYSGIPTPLSIFAIVDPETKKIIRFNGEDEIEGELIIAGPTVSKVLVEGTSYLKGQNMFGDYYAFTDDIVSLNKDGDIRYKERGDRVFQRFDGYNVKPWGIEEAFKKHPLVRDCIISPYFDEQNMGNMVKANVITVDELTESEKTELVKDLLEQAFMTNTSLATRQIPTKFLFRDSFPQKISEKTDFKTIYKEPLTGEEINVIIDETNININDIKVVSPNKGKVLSLNIKK